MNTLDELKKRREEEESARAATLQGIQDAAQNETARIMQEILAEIERYEKMSHANLSTHDSLAMYSANNAIAKDKEGIYIGGTEMHLPSLAMRMKWAIDSEERGVNTGAWRLVEEDWLEIVKKGRLPDNYKKWYSFLANDRDLTDRLIQAIRGATKRVYEESKIEEQKNKKRGRLIVAPISLLASILFFFLIFTSQSVSILLGTILLFVMTAVPISFITPSNSLGNRIAQVFCMPLAGGFFGLIVGLVAWGIHTVAPTFATVLWVIAVVIMNCVAIFVMPSVND